MPEGGADLGASFATLVAAELAALQQACMQERRQYGALTGVFNISADDAI